MTEVTTSVLPRAGPEPPTPQSTIRRDGSQSSPDDILIIYVENFYRTLCGFLHRTASLDLDFPEDFSFRISIVQSFSSTILSRGPALPGMMLLWQSPRLAV